MKGYHEYQSCIEACLRCAAICNHCASSCTQEKDVKMMARCISVGYGMCGHMLFGCSVNEPGQY